MTARTPDDRRRDQASANEFESGLDYGAYAEDENDAGENPTVSLPRSGADEGLQHTATLSAADLEELRRGDAEGLRERGRDVSASRDLPGTLTPPEGGTGYPPAGFAQGGSHQAGTGASGAAATPVAPAAPAAAPMTAAAATAPLAAVPESRRVAPTPQVFDTYPEGPTPEERGRLPKAGPRVAQVLLAIFAPIVLLVGLVRLVASPLFLWAEYHRPGFPVDQFGFTTQDRLHYGSAGLDFLFNAAGARYLQDLSNGGQPVFTADEVSHMVDVKMVMLITMAAGLVLALLCVALMVALARRSPGGIRRALFAGAVWFLIAMIVLAVLAALGWEAFFAGFHSLFFADGTWTFAANDALIRLYPEQFWVDAGIVLAALSVLMAVLTLIFTWPTRRRRELARDRRTQLEATRTRWVREADAQA
ncbi:MAG: TIGR01906 family membrane protein [Micrococcus sp.]|nr:TIGR01906 family membrane protein [Micrococcus sp.]